MVLSTYAWLGYGVSNSGTTASSLGPTPLSDVTPQTFPIKHFVFITMENHAYDTIFGTYCQKYSYYCDNIAHGLNTNYCVPLYPNDTSAGCQKPYPFSSATQIISDIPHGWSSSTMAYDKGKMDNFFRAEWGYPKNLTDARQTFGYYNGSTAPIFWDIAEQYGISENFFASNLSYSLPNHWFMQAAAAPWSSIHYLIGYSGADSASLQGNETCNATCMAELEYEDDQYTPSPVANATITVDQSYLDEANVTQTFEDLFNGTAVSWKYYYNPLASSYNQSLKYGNTFSFWDPNAARAESYTPTFRSHFVSQTQFAKDALAGVLPNVSWVNPIAVDSCHPIYGGGSEFGNLGWCQSTVAQYIDAVEKSPEWNSTAVFVTMDEYGGFYDNTRPPSLNGSSLGFRVPLMVVSPYTPQGYISHQLGYFESYLHTVEWKFGLPSLDSRDAGAPLLTGFFDTHAAPRPPFAFAGNYSNATYPEAYQVLPRPNPPIHLSATALSNSTVELAWNEGTGGGPVNGWVVKYGSTTLRLDRTVRDCVISGLTPGSNYTFSVYSTDGPNDSVTVTVHSSLPASPRPPSTVAEYLARWVVVPVRG
jgi:phospholipase C